MDDIIKREKPLLSIITICFNRAPDIEQTCESVVRQTWRGFEWIVVDGASTDGTVEALEKYRPHCAELISEPDRGIYHAMNKGIGLATGEYVLFLNGGDRLSADDSLEKSFAAAEHDADVLYGDIYLERDGVIIDRTTSPAAEEIDFLFFASDTIPPPASFIRRALFEKFGPHDESYRIVADLERWVTFAKNGCTFRNVGAVVSVFKLGGVSDEKQSTNTLRLAELDRMLAVHYSADQAAESRRRRALATAYVVTWFFLSLGAGLFLFSRKETRKGTRKVKWCVLGIPVLKKRSPALPDAKSEYLLLGFVPLSL